MSEMMKVVAVRLKSGEDLLGFFCGDSFPEEDSKQESAILLYQPILIKLATFSVHGTPVNTYITDMYFTYGDPVVAIPFSATITRSEASEFFTLFYSRTLGELLDKENTLHESYLKFFNDSDLAEIMRNTDSVFVPTDVDFLQ
jgi:hypothetical protein